MKLSDWAKKQGISYLTAYRWFKDGKLPVEAYQSDSGTIIVKDDAIMEQPMAGGSGNQSSDIMSLFLKKTVEFSKNNASVEDFAAYVLSNFSLKLNTGSDSPKYSRNKPKPEDVKKHFQQFLKPKGEKPKPYMFVTDDETLDDLVAESDNLTVQELQNQIAQVSEAIPAGTFSKMPHLADKTNSVQTIVHSVVPEMQDLIKDISTALSPPVLSMLGNNDGVRTYDSLGNTGGIVVRNVETTPQSINYTSSTNYASSFPGTVLSLNSSPASSYVVGTSIRQPSPEEIQKAQEVLGKVSSEIRSVAKAKRGRKPSKNSGKK
jgi:hypothetical protein